MHPRRRVVRPLRRSADCLPSPIHQRDYLVGGDVLTWDGDCKTVLSPVCTRSNGGEVRQVEIGSYPVMGEAQSDAALDAAVAAYDNGRGAWPRRDRAMLLASTLAWRVACCAVGGQNLPGFSSSGTSAQSPSAQTPST